MYVVDLPYFCLVMYNIVTSMRGVTAVSSSSTNPLNQRATHTQHKSDDCFRSTYNVIPFTLQLMYSLHR